MVNCIITLHCNQKCYLLSLLTQWCYQDFFFWSIFSVMICVCRCEHCIRKSGMLHWFSPLPSLFFQFATSANEEVLRAGLSAAFNKWGSKQTLKTISRQPTEQAFAMKWCSSFYIKSSTYLLAIMQMFSTKSHRNMWIKLYNFLHKQCICGCVGGGVVF